MRINPLHIHVNDPDFFDEIYAGSGRIRDKCLWFNPVKEDPNIPRNVFATRLHEKHRERRAVFHQFFSKRSIRDLEPVVVGTVQRLADRLRDHASNGSVVNLSDAYVALTMDVISAYCFGSATGLLADDEYGKGYRSSLEAGTTVVPMRRHIPFYREIMMLPPWLVRKLSPQSAALIGFINDLMRQIKAAIEGISERRTIFHEIRESDLPDQEKTLSRMLDEAGVLVGAGTVTTARTLAVVSFYLATRQPVRKRLMEELKAVMPTVDAPVSSIELERLPYLVSVFLCCLSFCISLNLR